jgi:hypothetical protein
MTSRAQFAQTRIAEICNALAPVQGSWAEVAESTKHHTLEALANGFPKAAVLKGGLRSEKVARNVFRRTFTTIIVARCKCNGLRFASADAFIDYLENLEKQLLTFAGPIKITSVETVVQVDPDEYDQAGITTGMIRVESIEEGR